MSSPSFKSLYSCDQAPKWIDRCLSLPPSLENESICFNWLAPVDLIERHTKRTSNKFQKESQNYHIHVCIAVRKTWTCSPGLTIATIILFTGVHHECFDRSTHIERKLSKLIRIKKDWQGYKTISKYCVRLNLNKKIFKERDNKDKKKGLWWKPWFKSMLEPVNISRDVLYFVTTQLRGR